MIKCHIKEHLFTLTPYCNFLMNYFYLKKNTCIETHPKSRNRLDGEPAYPHKIITSHSVRQESRQSPPNSLVTSSHFEFRTPNHHAPLKRPRTFFSIFSNAKYVRFRQNVFFKCLLAAKNGCALSPWAVGGLFISTIVVEKLVWHRNALMCRYLLSFLL